MLHWAGGITVRAGPLARGRDWGWAGVGLRLLWASSERPRRHRCRDRRPRRRTGGCDHARHALVQPHTVFPGRADPSAQALLLHRHEVFCGTASLKEQVLLWAQESLPGLPARRSCSPANELSHTNTMLPLLVPQALRSLAAGLPAISLAAAPRLLSTSSPAMGSNVFDKLGGRDNVRVAVEKVRSAAGRAALARAVMKRSPPRRQPVQPHAAAPAP